MRIVVVDDDKLVCLALKTIIEADHKMEVAAIGNSGLEAVELFSKHQPDLLLMDIRMEETNGLDAGKMILASFPEAKILFLTTFSDEEYVVCALRIGAKGYLLKQNFESIVPSIYAVMSGQNVFGDEIVSILPSLFTKEDGLSCKKLGITGKEFEIIELVSQGKNNKEIAQKLFLSEGTIRNYLSVILEKLQLRDRTQLVVFYYTKKLKVSSET